jgi:hypothetical protein
MATLMKRASIEKLNLSPATSTALVEFTCASEDQEFTVYRHKGDPNAMHLKGNCTVELTDLNPNKTFILESESTDNKPAYRIVD